MRDYNLALHWPGEYHYSAVQKKHSFGNRVGVLQTSSFDRPPYQPISDTHLRLNFKVVSSKFETRGRREGYAQLTRLK